MPKPSSLLYPPPLEQRPVTCNSDKSLGYAKKNSWLDPTVCLISS